MGEPALLEAGADARTPGSCKAGGGKAGPGGAAWGQAIAPMGSSDQPNPVASSKRAVFMTATST
jgi:hypothetical protein